MPGPTPPTQAPILWRLPTSGDLGGALNDRICKEREREERGLQMNIHFYKTCLIKVD